MAINALSAAQLQKQKEVNNFLAYLDGIQANKYDFRNEEVAMLDSDGIAGLSNTEITTVKARLTNLAGNINTYFNDDGTTKAQYDLDGDGNTSDDVQALGYIVNGRTQANSNVRVAAPEEMNGIASNFNFITKGGYKIAYDGGQNTVIYNSQNQVLTQVWGDPHVNEGSGGFFHFGDDSTFILPDGTKMYFNTDGTEASGVYWTTGLIIDDGSKTMFAGRVQAGGKTFNSGATAVDTSTLGADAALFSDASLADKGTLAHTGVFVYSEDANTGRSGWAMKTAEGRFEDVKSESWGDYLAVGGSSFQGQVEGTVQVSREARIAALDGTKVNTMRSAINSGASVATVDALLNVLESGIDAPQNANFLRLLNLGVNNENLTAYSNAIKEPNSRAAQAYDNMISGGVRKEIIEGFASLVNPDNSDRLVYSITANLRPDFTVSQIKDFVNLNHKTNAGEVSRASFNALNSQLMNPNVDGNDIATYTNYAAKYPSMNQANAEAFASVIINNKSNAVISALDSLVGTGASSATVNDYLAVVNDATIPEAIKDQVVSAYATIAASNPGALANLRALASQGSSRALAAFTRIAALNNNAHTQSFTEINSKTASASVKEAWLEELADYATAGASDKITVLKDLANVGYANSRAFIAGTGNLARALEVRALANSSAVYPMLTRLTEANVSSAVMDRLVTLAKANASPAVLNAFTTAHARKQANEITALEKYISLNAGDAFMQAFTDYISGTTGGAAAKVGAANTLVGLKEAIGARVYPTVETNEIKFAKAADAQMVTAIDNMVASIVSGSSTHVSNPEVIAIVNAELAKLSQAGISAKDQLIAVRSAASAINFGISDHTAKANRIKQDVEAGYARAISGTGGRGRVTPEERALTRLQNRLVNLRARREAYVSQLASLPADSADQRIQRRRQSIERRIASTDTQIAAVEAQIGNPVVVD